jgi:hypothetical protein
MTAKIQLKEDRSNVSINKKIRIFKNVLGELAHTFPTVLREDLNLNYNAVVRIRDNRLFCSGGPVTIQTEILRSFSALSFLFFFSPLS